MPQREFSLINARNIQTTPNVAFREGRIQSNPGIYPNPLIGWRKQIDTHDCSSNVRWYQVFKNNCCKLPIRRIQNRNGIMARRDVSGGAYNYTTQGYLQSRCRTYTQNAFNFDISYNNTRDPPLYPLCCSEICNRATENPFLNTYIIIQHTPTKGQVKGAIRNAAPEWSLSLTIPQKFTYGDTQAVMLSGTSNADTETSVTGGSPPPQNFNTPPDIWSASLGTWQGADFYGYIYYNPLSTTWVGGSPGFYASPGWRFVLLQATGGSGAATTPWGSPAVLDQPAAAVNWYASGSLEDGPPSSGWTLTGLTCGPSCPPTVSTVNWPSADKIRAWLSKKTNAHKTIYKRNNPQFSRQGAVSSRARLNRLKYNTIVSTMPANNIYWGGQTGNKTVWDTKSKNKCFCGPTHFAPCRGQNQPCGN